MQPYAKTHKSGALVTHDKNPINGMHEVKLYSSGGGLIDKMRCDTYQGALEYRKAFNAIAKNRCQS